MASWRELAAAARARQASSADVAAIEQPSAVDDDWGLNVDLVASLRALERLPAPRRIARREAWDEVVRDALYLARNRWAANALALGWDAHDLFGVGPNDSNEYDGLAVWLDGRKIAALDEWKARTTCGAWFYREGFMRPASPRISPVYLWQFGRGR